MPPFAAELARESPELAARLSAYRRDPGSVDPLSRSRLLVDAARHVSRFLVRLFGIEAEWQAQAAAAGPEAVLFRFRRDFLQRRAVKTKPPEEEGALAALAASATALERRLFGELPWEQDPELATSQAATALLDLESAFLAAVRQKKVPQVDPAARERALELAARARASGSAVAAPAGDGDEDAPGVAGSPAADLRRLVPCPDGAPRLAAGRRGLGLVPPPGVPRLPEPGRDRAPVSRAARGAGRAAVAPAPPGGLHADRSRA